jgi:hypothetical protein
MPLLPGLFSRHTPRMGFPQAGAGRRQETSSSRVHTFDEEFDWALKDILERDREITRDVPTAGLTGDELREAVTDQRAEIQAELLPETNRLQALRSELEDTERQVRGGGRWGSGPRRVVKVSGLLSLATFAVGVGLAFVGWDTAGVAVSAFLVVTFMVFLLSVAVVLVDVLVDWWGSERKERESRLYLLQRQVRSEEGIWRQALREKGIKPALRELINASTPNYETTFRAQEVAGLAELQDPSFEVRTAALVELERLVATMPGGSIGVSGPRGMGKTTLLRRFCSAEFRPSDEAAGKAPVRVLLPAPVRYDAREFVLHLFTTVCTSLTAPARRSPRWQPAHHGGSAALLTVALWSVAVLALLAALWGGVLAAGLVVDWAVPASLQPALVWLSMGLVVFAAAMVLRVLVRRDASTASAAADVGRDEGDSVVATAERLLVGLAYQQTFSAGWSGSVTVPIGAQVGFSANTTMTEKPMTFPELVQRLNDFLRMVAQERQVFIGIDELDKIDTEGDAYRFVNDIKGLFGHEHCYYLVSISQNAMSAFERRGLPLRDAFDSAFDAVVEVDHLDLTEAERLLRRRVIGMPAGFQCLCYVLSGGLPRDLIRSARDVVECTQGAVPSGELVPVTAEILRRDLGRKVQALRVAAHDLAVEPHTGLFVAQLDVVDDLIGTGSDLGPAVHQALGASVAATPGAVTGDEERRLLLQLGLLRVELAAYLYFVGTVLDFFTAHSSEEAIRLAESGSGPGSVRRLARARQAFAFSARSAWADVSAFRAGWGLPVCAFPEQLYAGPRDVPGEVVAQPTPGRVTGGLERLAPDPPV